MRQTCLAAPESLPRSAMLMFNHHSRSMPPALHKRQCAGARPVDGEQRPGEIAAGPENPREAKPRRIPAPSDAEPDQALT
jgi:hypothetical protein